MSIRVSCRHCRSEFNLADKLAGKRVKCPKCSQPLQVPAADGDGDLKLEAEAGPARTQLAGAWGAKGGKSHLDELLDEAGVKEAVQGPTCPECGAGVPENAVLCIECGYNFQLGRRIATTASPEVLELSGRGMTETEKILAKAERAIEENPIATDDQNFGDGADSYLIAMGAAVVGVVIVAAIVFVVFLLDRLTNSAGATALVMWTAGFIIYMIGWIWIMVVAFREGVGQGLGVLFCGPYALIFGFMRFNGLWAPTVCILMGIIAGVVGQLTVTFSSATPISG